MGKLRSTISMSVDGFVAGPRQSVQEPLGVGGERLHDWVVALEAWRRMNGQTGGEVNASTPVFERTFENIGATIMGRNMFGGGPGPWGKEPWRGWWGEDPPYHHPVFVLTHNAREPLQMHGGTTFNFVTDGIESALARAKAAAGAKDVMLAGGAKAIQQYLAARLVDEINISIVPIFLHDGARLFDDLAQAEIELEQAGAVGAPGVTHIQYRVR